MITMDVGIENLTITNASPFLYPCSLPCDSVWSSSQPLMLDLVMWLALANGMCTHLTRPIPSLGHKRHLMFLLAPIILLPSPWEECAQLYWSEAGEREVRQTCFYPETWEQSHLNLYIKQPLPELQVHE